MLLTMPIAIPYRGANRAAVDDLEEVYQKITVRGSSASNNGIREHIRKHGIQLNCERVISAKSRAGNGNKSARNTRTNTAVQSQRLRPKTTQTNVEEIVITRLPFYDELNYELSKRAGSAFRYSSKVTKLPSTEEPSLRNVYSPTSKIMSLPIKDSDRTPVYLGSRPTIASVPKSSQSLRFTAEQIALEKTRLLRKLSHIQTHRVDRHYFVSGSSCSIENRYSFDEAHLTMMIEMAKQKNTKPSGNKTSDIQELKHDTRKLEVSSFEVIGAKLTSETDRQVGNSKPLDLTNENKSDSGGKDAIPPEPLSPKDCKIDEPPPMLEAVPEDHPDDGKAHQMQSGGLDDSLTTISQLRDPVESITNYNNEQNDTDPKNSEQPTKPNDDVVEVC